MSHIFISYSRQDVEFARYVRAMLENQGFSVWMDEKRLSAGMDWWDEIENNIDSCTAFLVIMSPDSRDSVFVRNEILRALDQKRPLFPVLYRGKHFGMLAHAHYEEMLGGLSDTFSGDFLKRLQDVAGVRTSRTIRFEIVQNAIQSVEADVLLLKNALGAGGVSQLVKKLLKAGGVNFSWNDMKEVGDYKIIETQGTVDAGKVAYIKTERVGAFGYRQVREFSNRSLSVLGTETPDAKHIIMTIHGVNTQLQLDEGESVLAQVAGMVDVLQAWQAPHSLEKISIVEYSSDRVERLQMALQGFFDEVDYAQSAEGDNWAYDLTFERDSIVETPDAGAEQIKPYAVALFPEDPELEDIFYYGIQRPVHALGLLCERLNPELSDEDDSDNLQGLLERIKLASAVICDVTQVSPLLYYQLGYALGKDIPTALISRNEENPLGNEVTVRYEKIWQLEERLAQWLKEI